MRLNNVEAVLFDMDGTLIKHTWQTEELSQAFFDAFANQLAPLTADVFFATFWEKSTDMWYMMLDQVIDGRTAQLYGYRHTLRSLNQNPNLAQQMVDTWERLVLEEAQPFEDTYNVLQTVRQHYLTGILTNGFISLQRAKLNKYQLCQAVDICFVSEETGYHKPDSRVFTYMLTQLRQHRPQLRPEQVVYVGDNPVSDIAGAKAAGMQAVLIQTDSATSQFMPPQPTLDTPIIHRLSDLLPLLPHC